MPFWKKMFNKKQAVYYPRAIVDSDTLEWIELAPETEDQDPSGGGGGDSNDEDILS